MSERTKTYMVDIAGVVISAVVILLVFSFVNSSWEWLTREDVNAKLDRIMVVLIWLVVNRLNVARRAT